MHLQWFSQHGIPFTLIVAYIPLITAVATTVLSIVLARATLRYAETTDKSLALAREEFERQWSPELHIKLEMRNWKSHGGRGSESGEKRVFGADRSR